MATLPTIAIGANISLSGGSTINSGTTPLEVIASTDDDTTYLGDATNSDHTSTSIFELGNMPTDFATMNTLLVNLRYRRSANNANKLWTTLTAQVTDSGGTALSNEVTVASSITTITYTNSGTVSLTGLNTSANKTTWDGARIVIKITADRSAGGNADSFRVTSGELTGTYTEGIAPTTRTTSAATATFSAQATTTSKTIITTTQAQAAFSAQANTVSNIQPGDKIEGPKKSIFGGGTNRKIYNTGITAVLEVKNKKICDITSWPPPEPCGVDG